MIARWFLSCQKYWDIVILFPDYSFIKHMSKMVLILDLFFKIKLYHLFLSLISGNDLHMYSIQLSSVDNIHMYCQFQILWLVFILFKIQIRYLYPLLHLFRINLNLCFVLYTCMLLYIFVCFVIIYIWSYADESLMEIRISRTDAAPPLSLSWTESL